MVKIVIADEYNLFPIMRLWAGGFLIEFTFKFFLLKQIYSDLPHNLYLNKFTNYEHTSPGYYFWLMCSPGCIPTKNETGRHSSPRLVALHLKLKPS